MSYETYISRFVLKFPDVHVRIFWRYYYDTSWDFTREIKEEKLEF